MSRERERTANLLLCYDGERYWMHYLKIEIFHCLGKTPALACAICSANSLSLAFLTELLHLANKRKRIRTTTAAMMMGTTDPQPHVQHPSRLSLAELKLSHDVHELRESHDVSELNESHERNDPIIQTKKRRARTRESIVTKHKHFKFSKHLK